MAGGQNTFVSGNVLTAAQLNSYLMDQAVMRVTSGTRPTSAAQGGGLLAGVSLAVKSLRPRVRVIGSSSRSQKSSISARRTWSGQKVKDFGRVRRKTGMFCRARASIKGPGSHAPEPSDGMQNNS